MVQHVKFFFDGRMVDGSVKKRRLEMKKRQHFVHRIPISRLAFSDSSMILCTEGKRDHPFKMSSFFRGRGVKNLPNLPTDSSKKLPTEEGRGQKS